MAKKQTWAEMDKSNIPLDKLIEGFALYNRTTNKSPRTVDWYSERLGGFLRFAGDGGDPEGHQRRRTLAPSSPISRAGQRATPTTRSIKNKDRPLSSAYIQSFARALRAFSSWLYEDGYTDTNVLRPLKPPKIQQKLVEVLSDEEIERLLAVFDLNDPYGARNYAIVFTMLDAGLRASELLDLTLTNARLQEGFLKVLGKGNKERLIPVGRRCQEALRAWLERFRPQFDLEGIEPHVFLNADGQRMTLRSLEEMIGRSGTKAGVPGLHPHRLTAHLRNALPYAGTGGHVPAPAVARAYESGDGPALRFGGLGSTHDRRESSVRYGQIRRESKDQHSETQAHPTQAGKQSFGA